MSNVERTLSIVKPDAVAAGATGDILSRFEKAGLTIIALKKMQLSQTQAQGFYAVHKERPFFGELVKFMTEGPIVVSATVNPPAAGPAFGVHICDLEVDPETGVSRVVRYTVAQDAGKAIHPTYVEGQFQGGAAQGIGWALNEEYLWDAEGKVENAGFLDYRIPVASDLPMIDTVIVEVANPLHPYGVRGVGETPIVPPLATVANAMRAATGVRFSTLPMSPPRVLEALDDSAAKKN